MSETPFRRETSADEVISPFPTLMESRRLLSPVTEDEEPPAPVDAVSEPAIARVPPVEPKRSLVRRLLRPRKPHAVEPESEPEPEPPQPLVPVRRRIAPQPTADAAAEGSAALPQIEAPPAETEPVSAELAAMDTVRLGRADTEVDGESSGTGPETAAKPRGTGTAATGGDTVAGKAEAETKTDDRLAITAGPRADAVAPAETGTSATDPGKEDGVPDVAASNDVDPAKTVAIDTKPVEAVAGGAASESETKTVPLETDATAPRAEPVGAVETDSKSTAEAEVGSVDADAAASSGEPVRTDEPATRSEPDEPVTATAPRRPDPAKPPEPRRFSAVIESAPDPDHEPEPSPTPPAEPTAAIEAATATRGQEESTNDDSRAGSKAKAIFRSRPRFRFKNADKTKAPNPADPAASGAPEATGRQPEAVTETEDAAKAEPAEGGDSSRSPEPAEDEPSPSLRIRGPGLPNGRTKKPAVSVDTAPALRFRGPQVPPD